jgi:hypothetical protein
MFQGIREIRKGFQARASMCKDKEGNLIGEERKVLERWAKYYTTLLNTGVEEIIEEEEDEVHPDEEEPELDSIGKEEIEEAIEDGIQAELIQYGEAFKEEIYKLVKTVWEKEEMPQECNTAIICPIHKKNDKMECNNYREISLIKYCL